MVLEQIYPISWLEQKKSYAFLLGVTYSILGIFSALLIFPQNIGIVSIAFTSLLLLPSLNRLISLEENEAGQKGYNIYNILYQHWDVIKIYFFMFLGILLTYAITTILLPDISASFIFAKQAKIIGALGSAASLKASFTEILFNNLWVLIVMLIASFIYGAGSVFIITWNAAVWGFVFGLIAHNASIISQHSPLIAFILTIISVLPHMIFETAAYFFVAVSGGVISTAVIREKLLSTKFKKIVVDAFIIFGVSIVFLLLAALIEIYVPGKILGFLI